jgi:hypothetical protein
MWESALEDAVEGALGKLYPESVGVLQLVAVNTSKVDKLVHHILGLV